MYAWVYMLECSDGAYYVGSHRGDDVSVRVGQHQAGLSAYTSVRRPVRLVWADNFIWITDAIAFERKLKGWSRTKKEALIRGDWTAISALAKRRGGAGRPSRLAALAPQDEEEGGALSPRGDEQPGDGRACDLEHHGGGDQ